MGVLGRPAREGPAGLDPLRGPPREIVANSFGFAEKLLASQKAFAEKVVAASAPVFEAPKSK